MAGNSFMRTRKFLNDLQYRYKLLVIVDSSYVAYNKLMEKFRVEIKYTGWLITGEDIVNKSYRQCSKDRDSVAVFLLNEKLAQDSLYDMRLFAMETHGAHFYDLSVFK